MSAMGEPHELLLYASANCTTRAVYSCEPVFEPTA